MLRYLCFLVAVVGAMCGSAPFITPCKSSDSACLVSSAQAAVPVLAGGVPALAVRPVDPLHIARVNSDQGGLRLQFKDTTVTGLKGCKVEGVRVDLRKGKQSVVTRCTVTLTGDYTLGGRLALLPVEGQGTYIIHIRDIVLKTVTELATVPGADGRPHWHISDWRHSYRVQSGADFKFNNLFNGNKILAEPVEQFLNTNWQDVMQEVAPPIVRAVVAGVIEAVEDLYKAVPAEELYIN